MVLVGYSAYINCTTLVLIFKAIENRLHNFLHLQYIGYSYQVSAKRISNIGIDQKKSY